MINGQEQETAQKPAGSCNRKSAAGGKQGNQKTATNNQWVSTGLKSEPDRRERRDGPGGEDADR